MTSWTNVGRIFIYLTLEIVALSTLALLASVAFADGLDPYNEYIPVPEVGVPNPQMGILQDEEHILHLMGLDTAVILIHGYSAELIAGTIPEVIDARTERLFRRMLEFRTVLGDARFAERVREVLASEA